MNKPGEYGVAILEGEDEDEGLTSYYIGIVNKDGCVFDGSIILTTADKREETRGELFAYAKMIVSVLNLLNRGTRVTL